jgi:hypothetical protein
VNRETVEYQPRSKRFLEVAPEESSSFCSVTAGTKSGIVGYAECAIESSHRQLMNERYCESGHASAVRRGARGASNYQGAAWRYILTQLEHLRACGGYTPSSGRREQQARAAFCEVAPSIGSTPPSFWRRKWREQLFLRES